MMKSILVIEPPFIEPGIPRPEIYRIVDICRNSGLGTDPELIDCFDLNLFIYRSILSTSLTSANHYVINAKMEEQLLNCFFLKKNEWDLVLKNNDKNSCNDVPEDIIEAFRMKLSDPLKRSLSSALTRFNEDSLKMTHKEYVSDIQVFNFFIDCFISNNIGNYKLSISECEIPDLRTLDDIIDYLSDDNIFTKLFDYFSSSIIDKIKPYDRCFIVISNYSQLIPGLVFSNWVKTNTNKETTISGRIGTKLINNFDNKIFDFCDIFLSEDFTISAPEWIYCLPHNNIHRNKLNKSEEKIEIYKPVFGRPINFPKYISPTRITSFSTTTRCYWSKCMFCGLTDELKYPYSYINLELLNEFLSSCVANNIKHLQFLDYAMPANIVKQIVNLNKSIAWSNQMRFEKFCLSPKFFEKISEKGCCYISWGFESGSDALLNRCKKGLISSNERKEILRRSKDVGIKNSLFIICGLPGETENDFFQTVSFLESAIYLFDAIEIYAYQHCIDNKYYKLKSSRLPTNNVIIMQNNPFNPLTVIAENRKRTLESMFGLVGGINKTSDLLEGHQPFINSIS